MEIVNNGVPFLRVTCQNVDISKEALQQIKHYPRWSITGNGNMFKTKVHPVLKNNSHTPDGIGVAIFSYDLITELYFPPGIYSINFGPIPPTPAPMPTHTQYEPSSALSDVISDENIPGLTVDREIPIIVGIERSFDNLDFEDDDVIE